MQTPFSWRLVDPLLAKSSMLPSRICIIDESAPRPAATFVWKPSRTEQQAAAIDDEKNSQAKTHRVCALTLIIIHSICDRSTSSAGADAGAP